MKKLTAIFCALVLAIGANAMPVKKAPQVQPIQKAAQGDVKLASPSMFLALYDGSQYTIHFYAGAENNPTEIALAKFKPSDVTVLDGVYTVAQSTWAINNGQIYSISESGNLSLIYRGQSLTTGDDIFDVVATDWYAPTTETTYDFSGTVSGMACYKQYYEDCTGPNKTNCDIARITLTKPSKNTEAEIQCMDVVVDETGLHPSDPKYRGTWTVKGIGDSEDGRQFALELALYGNQLEGSYTESDVQTAEGGGLYAFIYLLDKNYNQTGFYHVSSLQGTVTKTSLGHRMDFYVTAKDNNKTYHFVMYYGYNNVILGDTDEDFRASFSLNQMTPLTTANFTGTYNGCQYFSVEVNNGTQYADLLFFANRVDPTITIPAGVYSVSANNVASTMQKGEIMQDEEGAYFNPSFAATLTSQGGKHYIDKGFLITEGTAEVKNADGKLFIVVNGSNSYYRTVQITIGTAPVDGIEEVNMDEVEDGQKMMIDGQLYIKRGENLYNAQGVVVK